jgi:hypothetical protein
MTLMSRKQEQGLLISAILIVYALAWSMQSAFLLNCDVSWDIRITERLLAGGTYMKDFFDINPPLILFIYIPSVMFAKILSIKLASGLLLYTFLLSSLSLYFCYTFINKIFLPQHRFITYALLSTIAFLFLILPLMDFGEREHLMIIFTLPYFFAVSYRMQGKTINPYYSIAIGFFAAWGFAIKPYFLLAPLLVELYYIWYTRNLFAWFRLETMTILVFLVIYTLSIFIFYPSYLSSIVPLSMMFYYSGFSEPWSKILLKPAIFFCFLSITFCLLLNKKNPYKTLNNILLIATIAFLISHFIQHTSWRYHYFPAFFIAILLYVGLFSGLCLSTAKKSIHFRLTFLLMTMALALPVIYFNTAYLYAKTATMAQRKLIGFLQTNAEHKSVYFLTVNPSEIFPAVDYTNVTYGSRFQHLLWIPGAVKEAKLYGNHKLPLYKLDAENTFLTMLNEDLSATKPDLIFVDVKDYQPLNWLINFDYLAYLLQNQTFQSLWKNYHYVTTIEANFYDTDNAGKWELYLQPANTPPQANNIKNHAIVLTGSGRSRVAYFVNNKQLIAGGYSPLTRRINLSADELKFILAQTPGIIARNATNKALVDAIINNAIFYSTYKFQIYQRNL